jgi:alkylhydroperoxidase family enzyme
MIAIDKLVPGFATALENVPGTLHAHQRLEKALEGGVFTARVRALIGLAVAAQIRCDYCQWVYSRIGANAGLTGEDTIFAGAGTSIDRREAAILRLAQRMVAGGILLKKVDVEPRDVGVLRDSEVAEVAAHVAFTILTCYVIQGIAPSTRRAAQPKRAI